jgi:hypothetical protein
MDERNDNIRKQLRSMLRAHPAEARKRFWERETVMYGSEMEWSRIEDYFVKRAIALMTMEHLSLDDLEVYLVDGKAPLKQFKELPHYASKNAVEAPRCQAHKSDGIQCDRKAKRLDGYCGQHETQFEMLNCVFVCQCGDEYDSFSSFKGHQGHCLFNRERIGFRNEWKHILVKLFMNDLQIEDAHFLGADGRISGWYCAVTILARHRLLCGAGLYVNPRELWDNPESIYFEETIKQNQIHERRKEWRDFGHFSKWALGKVDYYDYIQSEEWREKADRAKWRAGMRCQLCNRHGTLNAHHRTYERLGHELDEDLIVLCRDCHKMFHENRKVAS